MSLKLKFKIQEKPGDVLEYWGYIHKQDKKLKVKRYYSPLDLEEAKNSPFCMVVLGPVAATSSALAKELLTWEFNKKYASLDDIIL